MIIRNVYKYFSHKVKSFDRYGKLITFTFKGEEEYKSCCGGVISLTILIILILYAQLMLTILFGKKDTKKVNYGLAKDLLKDTDEVSLSTTTFSFGLQAKTSTFDLTTDETYLFLEINQVYAYTDASDNILYTTDNIDYDQCGSTYFKYDEQWVLDDFGISEYICPTSSNFVIQGNEFSDSYRYFEIIISKCTNGTRPGVTWQTASDIEDAIDDLNVDLSIVNSYFDFDDYNNPIHTYLDDRYSFDTISGLAKTANIYLRKNQVEVQDSFFTYAPGGDKSSFVNIKRYDTLISNENDDGTVLSIYFMKDYEYETYERSVYSFLDFAGNLGGINEVLEVIGGLLVGIVADKLFFYSILSRLYQVDPLSKQELVDKAEKEKQDLMPSDAQSNIKVHS